MSLLAKHFTNLLNYTLIFVRLENLADNFLPPLEDFEKCIPPLKKEHNLTCTLARESIIKEQMKHKHQFDKKVSKNR